MPEKDYQSRSIVEKLGVKPGYAVACTDEVRKIDAGLCQLIVEGAGRSPATEDEALDIVLVFVDEATDAVEVLEKWRERLTPGGGIWLLTAKRGQAGYVDQRELIAAGQLAKVVDNKVCSVSASLSAMRFVVRKKDRVGKAG